MIILRLAPQLLIRIFCHFLLEVAQLIQIGVFWFPIQFPECFCNIESILQGVGLVFYVCYCRRVVLWGEHFHDSFDLLFERNLPSIAYIIRSTLQVGGDAIRDKLNEIFDIHHFLLLREVAPNLNGQALHRPVHQHPVGHHATLIVCIVVGVGMILIDCEEPQDETFEPIRCMAMLYEVHSSILGYGINGMVTSKRKTA